MTTETRRGFLFMELGSDILNGEWEEKWHLTWRDWKREESATFICIGEHTISAEIPADFDQRSKKIAALEEQKRELQAKFQAALTEITRRISELQAISYEAAEVQS